MLIGKPLAKSINRIKIFKKNVPMGFCSILVIIIFILVLLLALLFFVPALVNEVKLFKDFDYDSLVEYFSTLFNNIQIFLYNNNLIDSVDSLVEIIIEKANKVLNFKSISTVIGNVVSSTGSFFLGLFAVFFIAFFFIKDDIKIENLFKFFFSEKYSGRVTQVMNKINNLLSRYFVGLLIKTFIMIIILYAAFAIFGIKGALLMAFIGGITNIIPYFGPFIGGAIICLFGTINCISIELYTGILPMIIKVCAILIGANVIDNWFLGPYIYSQSIKVHPVEVFIVTILGGSIGGIAGMVLGIPVYTILRVTVMEIYNSIFKKSDDIINPGNLLPDSDAS